DSVAAHHDGLLPPRLIQVCRVQRHRILGAELEYIPNFDHALDAEHAVAAGAAVAFLHLADVGELGLVVTARLDAEQVEPGAVRAAHELAVAERLVGDGAYAGSHRADRARLGPEGVDDLLPRRGPVLAAEHLGHLQLVQAVVAAKQPEHHLAVLDDD